MHKITIFLSLLVLINLSGCNTPAITTLSKQLPNNPDRLPLKESKPITEIQNDAATSLPKSIRDLPIPSALGFTPTNAHLVQAGEVFMQLRRANGNKNPERTSLQSHLALELSINTAEANVIVDKLRLY